MSRDKCLQCLLSLFLHSCQTIYKTRDSFINWICENWPISSPVQLLTQKLFSVSNEGFKITSCCAPQTWYLYSIQIWRVIRWPLFLFKHLRTVLVEALLWDTCNVHRAQCILLNLLLRLAAVGCTLQWTLAAEINKKNFNCCLQQH